MIKFNSAANSSNKNKVSLKLNYYDSNRHGSLKRYPTKKKIKLDGTYAIRDNRTKKLFKKSKIFRDPLLKIDPLLKKKEEKKRKILGAPVIPTNLAQTIDLLPSHSVKKKKEETVGNPVQRISREKEMFIERWSLRGRFRWIVGAGLLALAAYRSETGERRLQDETSDCDSLLPTTIAPYVRSRARPLGQRRTNGKETRRPRRCTLIVAWRCLLKNFVSHQPRRERRLHGTVEALSEASTTSAALPLSCKRPSFRFVLCPR